MPGLRGLLRGARGVHAASLALRRLDEAASASGWAQFDSSRDYENLAAVGVCIVSAALAAGLTMGMVSVELLDLKVKLRTGTDDERAHARALLPLKQREPHHQLLVTLLLYNALANEALPLFLDELVPSYAAVLLSVTLVLFFGEIIPSAVFTGPSKLRIAAAFKPFVDVLLVVLAPLAYPIALALDRCIPEEAEVTTRAEVRALVQVQHEEASGAEPFNSDEAALVQGALSLTKVTAADVMIPIARVGALRKDAVLDRATMTRLLQSGFSRIPLHAGAVEGVDRYLIVKEHILLDPDDAAPVAGLRAYSPVWVAPDASLFQALNTFQTGRTHMAFVSRDPELARASAEQGLAVDADSRAAIVGILTLEDIIEEILTEEIYDETDRDGAERKLQDFIRLKMLPVFRMKHRDRDGGMSPSRRALREAVDAAEPPPESGDGGSARARNRRTSVFREPRPDDGLSAAAPSLQSGGTSARTDTEPLLA